MALMARGLDDGKSVSAFEALTCARMARAQLSEWQVLLFWKRHV